MKAKFEKFSVKCAIVFSMVVSLFCVFSVNISATEETSFFSEYITKCFNNPQNLKVFEDGVDETESFITEYLVEFQSGDIESIREFVTRDNVEICYIETANKERKTDSASRIYQFYKAATDSTGSFTKEWLINLQCYVTWDGNTYRITSVNRPLLYIANASWGVNWSPYLYNVGTNYSINSSRTAVTFSGNYTMMGTYSIMTGLSRTYNFGSYYISQTFYV